MKLINNIIYATELIILRKLFNIIIYLSYNGKNRNKQL